MILPLGWVTCSAAQCGWPCSASTDAEKADQTTPSWRFFFAIQPQFARVKMSEGTFPTAPTTEQKMQKSDLHAAIKMHFVHQRASFQDAHDQFVAKLANDPFYALEWADRFARQVAEYRVAVEVINLFEADVTPEQIAAELQRRVIDYARQPTRSTSALTNLMAENYLAATSRALEPFHAL